ncbi:hypothetical protein NEUTE2DRAFT_56759 [Neurospora tetrasperma FGSC 2509]|nr:hypothetical protein NEUTE2DRAFT_56759 [Neurospora tetrasperma FGSC 2509]
MRSWKMKRNYFELKSVWAFCNKGSHRMDGRKESWISVLVEVYLCLWVPAAVQKRYWRATSQNPALTNTALRITTGWQNPSRAYEKNWRPCIICLNAGRRYLTAPSRAACSRYYNDGKRCDRASPLTLRAVALKESVTDEKEKSLAREQMNRCMAIQRNAAELHKHGFCDRQAGIIILEAFKDYVLIRKRCNFAPLGLPSLRPIQARTSVSK